MDTKRKPVPRAHEPDSQPGPSSGAGPSTSQAPARATEEDTTTEPDHDLPPSYTGPSLPIAGIPNRASEPTSPALQQGTLPVNLKAYRMAGVALSKDKSTYTTTMPQYSQSPQALAELIQAHAKLPPHPQIRIVALRSDGTGPYFDIRISMLKYFVRPPDARGSAGWQYLRLIRDGELGWRGGKQAGVQPVVAGGLDDWISRYVAEEAKDKSFVLRKQITNWNTHYLDGAIRSVIASTGYKGQLTISFPVTHSTLLVQSPKNSKAWYEAIADAFKAKNSRRYEVVTAVWPYAALAADDASGQGNAYAVKSETEFWNEWKDVVKAAALDQHRGWLTMEHHVEWAMGNGWADRNQTAF